MVNINYIFRFFKRLSLLWFFHLMILVSFLLLIIISVLQFFQIKNTYDNSIKLILFITLNIKLILNFSISLRIISTSQRQVSLLFKQHSINILMLIISIIILSLAAFIGIEYSDIPENNPWLYVISVGLITVNFFMLCLIIKFKSSLCVQTYIFNQINLLDCLTNILMICIFFFDAFKDYFILSGNLIAIIYIYLQTQLILKHDFAVYYEDYKNKDIFNNLKCLKQVFCLNNFLAEFSDEEHFIIKQADRSTLSQSEIDEDVEFVEKEKEYIKSKEYIYFNFCILTEIFNSKLARMKNKPDRSFDSSNSTNNITFNLEKTEIKFNTIIEKYFVNYLPDDSDITFERFIKFFENEKMDEDNISIFDFQPDKFDDLIHHLGVNHSSIIEALNPSKNYKICRNIEKKFESNNKYNDFYSNDCFLNFEIYDHSKIDKILTFMKEYFTYMKTLKNDFQKSFLPLILGCFELKYLNLHYIIIIYRNPYAFSVFHEMKHYFFISIDDLQKKVTFTSNPEYDGNIVSNNEIEIMNDIYLQDDDYKAFKKSLQNDLNFLVKQKVKYNINIFIMNDNFTQNSEKNISISNNFNNERISTRFNFSIIDRMSEGSNMKKLPASTLSCFEELFIIKYNRNCRYIIKIYFVDLFSDFIKDDSVVSYRNRYFFLF